jgi:nucleoside 2-deoxyribosyltransferase
MGKKDYGEYLASREWALLRNKRMEMSGGICERCKTNPADQVHHLTYERVKHERISDLRAICRPCHEYLSGKSHTDPFTPQIYFAGRVFYGNYREIMGLNIMNSLHDDTDFTELYMNKHSFFYGGPSAIPSEEMRHRGADDINHGYTDAESTKTVERCFKQIKNCDIFYCFIDDLSSYGTFVEIGFALALNKTIKIVISKKANTSAMNNEKDELWFFKSAPGVVSKISDDPFDLFDKIFTAF